METKKFTPNPKYYALLQQRRHEAENYFDKLKYSQIMIKKALISKGFSYTQATLDQILSHFAHYPCLDGQKSGHQAVYDVDALYKAVNQIKNLSYKEIHTRYIS